MSQAFSQGFSSWPTRRLQREHSKSRNAGDQKLSVAVPRRYKSVIAAAAHQPIGKTAAIEQSFSNANGSTKWQLVSAAGLITGTAVGPGILGLPAATLPLGLKASTVMILFAWAYVTASILLVAELSCAVMSQMGVKEVSFTALVAHTLGLRAASLVAVVYASLNYALLVACIAGMGSILQAFFRLPGPVRPLLSAVSAAGVGGLVAFAPFKIIDAVNRALCGLMIAGISGAVGLGLYAGREFLFFKANNNVLSFSAIQSALPITVLTLGFHVITPVICGVVGGKGEDARRAIFMGGVVPLVMVLVWNGVVLGLAPPNSTSSSLDPIKLLLSLSEVSAIAVQAFAFAALGTTLIGYALSFPKQLSDTVQIVVKRQEISPLIWSFAPPTCVAVFWPTAFASAVNFAGIYANCFLFGILPPIMAWIHRYGSATKGDNHVKPLLPGGKLSLLLLLAMSVGLGIRAGPGSGGS